MTRQLYIVDDKGQVVDLQDKVFLITADDDVDSASLVGIRLDNFNVGNCFLGPESE